MRPAEEFSGFFARWTLRMQTEVLIALLVIFIALGVWSSFGRLRAGGSIGLKAKNLFLTVRTQAGHQIHIITWGPHDLTFVSPRYLGKGETLRVDVRSLPGFPEGTGFLDLEVKHAKPMLGEQNTYVITARVADAAAERQEVRRFLEQLTRPGRLSHA
jgi:hypothetical protein